ncbi:MAG: SpoIIE family protein phosphatase [Chloroflexi bacterium]|nr:SpoIIE family protein phosphatase [Chloroflexota bacterium]MBK6709095.1 SpoIIE family protein phosphatase [Chloroflexota bacterium]MBP6805233.1 SpoIIE family protein phosphatase [Chloroflexota bacterium]MBP7593370.1 SpoIIE family protein phosphatase [Chloroflexota bacterium]
MSVQNLLTPSPTMSISYAHLLVVDTDESRLNALIEPLQTNGWYAVTTCQDIQTALYNLTSYAYDLVMIDVTLASAADHEFLRRIQAHPRLNQLPVILLATPLQMEAIANALEMGAVDYLFTPVPNILLKARLTTHLQQREVRAQALSCLNAFNSMKQLADDLREVILPLGIALSAEKNFDRLLETIVVEAKAICNADAATLYLRTEDERLAFTVMRTYSLNLAYGGPDAPAIPIAPLPLFMPNSGQPNHNNIATYVALTGQSVNIPDVYNAAEFDFSGTKAFDKQHNYRSISCLTVPLKNNDVIGVLQLLNAKSVVDDHIIPFTIYHKLVAESLASQAAVVLTNHVLRQRQESLLQAERELEIGRRVQAEFLPTHIPQPPGWEIAFHFEPSRVVAGDFYDVFYLPNNKIGLVIADVCDKGVAAAIFMAQVRSLLRAFIQQHYFLGNHNLLAVESPYVVPPELTRFRAIDFSALVDSVMLTNVQVGSNHGNYNMFVTIFLASLDPISGEFIYINSGHLPPLVLSGDGIRQWLMPTGPAVGLTPDARFQVGSGCLQPGETLLAYTDGITEARNPENLLFGKDRLTAVLAEGKRPSTAADLLQYIVKSVQTYQYPAGQYDDITLMAVRHQPSI